MTPGGGEGGALRSHEKNTVGAVAQSVERVLDARRLVCPEPIVQLATAIRELPVGASIRLLTTDPGSDADVRAWARHSGQDLVEALRVDGEFHFVLRRTR